MKMNLSSVSVDQVVVSDSKKNSGGAFAKMKITGTMTKEVRKRLGIGNDGEEWPPDGEKAGKLKGSFDCVNVILTRKQGDLLEGMNEADIKVSLADSFVWKLEDPKDETNKTVLYSCWMRTAELEAAQLMTEYKFAVQGGESTGVLNYNKPGDGKAVDMSDPNQLNLSDEARAAVRDMPEGEGGKAPTHAEKKRARDEETAKKQAIRKGATVVN